MKDLETARDQLQIAIRALREIAHRDKLSAEDMTLILAGVKPCCQAFDVIAHEALDAMEALGPLELSDAEDDTDPTGVHSD